MIKVWVLVIYMTGSGTYHGGPAVIDNIRSQQECQRIAKIIHDDWKYHNVSAQCIEVIKKDLAPDCCD